MARSREISVSELGARYARARRNLERGRIMVEMPRGRIVWGHRSTAFDPTNLARWLLSFVQADLETLSPDQWQDLQDELVVFSLPPAQFSPSSRPSVGDLERPPKKREVEAIQLEVRRGITRLFNSPAPRSWSIPNLQIRRIVFRRQDGTIGRGYWGRIFRERFLMTVADVLESVGDRIKRCPECRCLFVAVKRQAYCSRRHSQRVRSRKFRAVHKEALPARRRARYEAKQRTLLGQHVRIQRREP